MSMRTSSLILSMMTLLNNCSKIFSRKKVEPEVLNLSERGTLTYKGEIALTGVEGSAQSMGTIGFTCKGFLETLSILRKVSTLLQEGMMMPNIRSNRSHENTTKARNWKNLISQQTQTRMVTYHERKPPQVVMTSLASLPHLNGSLRFLTRKSAQKITLTTTFKLLNIQRLILSR